MTAARSHEVSKGKKAMIKKVIGLALCSVILALCSGAEAQQTGKIHRIGLLISASSTATAPYIEAFRQRMRELGYVEGKNYRLEIRGGGAEPERLAHLAHELVQHKVDIIVAGGTPAVRAAMKATSAIPIVMRMSTDPVEAGFIPDLSHPGGNITGVTSITRKLIGKQLELLAEVIPGLNRVAVLVAHTNLSGFMASAEYKEMKVAAQMLGVKLQVLSARDPDTIETAFLTLTKDRIQGLILTPQPPYLQHRDHIVKHAAKNRLPAVYYQSLFVENGGLMSYATDNADEFRRAARYVDKILKGAKPADLPVEQPTKFEFVINLKTAKQIGLTIPPNVLARADRVIR
jgi:putative tryptophan/tyrosine transport system substrate-binding protein